MITDSTSNTTITTSINNSRICPLRLARHRHLKREETVDIYFNQKLRLLRQTSLNELEILQQLTSGLPLSWQLNIASAKPTNTSDWIKIAKQIELHKESFLSERRHHPRPFPTFISEQPYISNACNQIPLCKICERLGQTNYHWHRLCPNHKRFSQRLHRTKTTTQSTEPSSAIHPEDNKIIPSQSSVIYSQGMRLWFTS